MSEYLPYDEIKVDRNVKLEDIFIFNGDSDIGYFIEVDLIYPDNIKKKRKISPFAPENKKVNPDIFNHYLKKINLILILKPKKLICDRSDTRNYIILYRMLKIYVRHGTIIDEVSGQIYHLDRVSGQKNI